ncbi:MAG TPA: LacI family DNA-binding transcriptional regulator [Chitinophagaceae bacterium]
MKYDNITIKDIAKALNLTASTVSRALRDKYDISAETKNRVLAYAEKANYRPHPMALGLKEKKTRSIGIVVSEIANNYFSQAINGIESIANSRGYHIIIIQTHESSEREKNNVHNLVARGVDGLLISMSNETKDTSYLQHLKNKGLPIVFFDRIPGEIETYKVIANNYLGAFQATEHLISQGLKKIAHITSSPHLSITKERLSGYKDALNKHKIKYREELVKFCEYGGMRIEEIEDAISSLFALKTKPDALFLAGDRISTQSLQVLRKLGKMEKLKLVGFTNTSLSDLFLPSLTVVEQPAYEMGQVATEFLIQLIESKHPVSKFDTRVIDTKLIVRDSSTKQAI